MQRPVLHDARFAMTDDLRNHISLLEEYATRLEGAVDLAKGIIREQNEKLAAANQAPVAKPPGFSGLGDIMESFFGPKK